MYEIRGEFRKGKQVTGGVATPTEPLPVVTVVGRSEVDEVIGARSVRERVRFLRGVRDAGGMVTNDGRLTQRVRRADGSRSSAYVFRCDAESIPRLRKQRRGGVGYW